MKKPGWVSFFGWSFVFCVSVWLAVVFFTWHQVPGEPARTIAQVALLAAVPSIVCWLLGSVVFAVSRARAKTQAESVSQMLRTGWGRADECSFPGPDGARCDLPAGHAGPHRGVKPGPQRVATSPLGLTGSDGK